MNEHEWFYAEFSYATWTECTCGYRPDTEADFIAHNEKVAAVS